MFGQAFSHDELAKYTAIFGTLFNNIIISRTDDEGEALQTFKVAINYGPREKALARTMGDPELNVPYNELMPRMAFEMLDFEYDGNRKKPSTTRWTTQVKKDNGRTAYNAMFMPVPYNFRFRLTILANRMRDATRILGSILPFFRPDLTVTASIVDYIPDYVIDIPIVLNSIESRDEYEGDFTKKRVIEYHLDFTMKAEVYGPVSEAKIIKIAKVNLYADRAGTYDEKPSERITTQPGLTVDGKPTSDITQTIPPREIEETDDFGYIITVQDRDLG